jgi:hypothetical protein
MIGPCGWQFSRRCDFHIVQPPFHKLAQFSGANCARRLSRLDSISDLLQRPSGNFIVLLLARTNRLRPFEPRCLEAVFKERNSHDE